MNRHDPFPPAGTEAQIRFLDGDFRILRPGAFVSCAVTGVEDSCEIVEVS